MLGDRSPSGSHYYLMEEGQPDVYLIPSSVGTAWTLTRNEMHVASLPQIAVENISQVSLRHAGGEPITIEVAPERQSLGLNALWMTSPIDYQADAAKGDEYFQHIAAIALTGFADTATPETLAQYGLDAPRHHLMVYGESTAGERATVLDLCIGDACSDDAVYARIDDTNDVYTLDRASVAFLSSVSTESLIDRFANIIYVADVDRVHIAGGDLDETMEILRTPALDENGEPRMDENGTPVADEAYRVGGKLLDTATFRSLYQLIIGTRIDGLLPDGWHPASGVEPALRVVFSLTGGEDEEVIEYLPYNADCYAVRRNGLCLFYILRSRVDVIPEALAAHREGAFDPAAYGLL